jgi:uncharacterized cupin superfamily protein
VRPVFNLASGELPSEGDRNGWRHRGARVGDEIGASTIGGGVYELPAGERTFPYHYHHGVEEWLIVVDGTPLLRTPDGTRELRVGDVVCFPMGADGAHGVTGPGRVLIVSTGGRPSIAVYPDSDKIGPRSGEPDDTANFRRTDSVDYWDGER